MSARYRGPQGLELAHRTLSDLESRGLPPTPENYAIWCAFITGDNPDLAREVRALIDAGAAITDAVTNTLFARHFAKSTDAEAVISAGGRFADEIAQVMASLRTAEENAKAYGETLEDASGRLSSAEDPLTLKRMVETLSQATHRMHAQSQELERKLHVTTSEVQQLRTNLEKVREEALTDALTGLANRKRFDDALRRAFDQPVAAAAPYCIMMVDIDHFKRFNDTWGHQTGDQIIRFAANALQRGVNEPCLVCRYGGEEFAVLMPNTTAAEARDAADRIRRTVETKKLLRRSTNEHLGHVTVSIGIAQRFGDEESWEFVERADQSLYIAKQTGRNRVAVSETPPAAQAA